MRGIADQELFELASSLLTDPCEISEYLIALAEDENSKHKQGDEYVKGDYGKYEYYGDDAYLKAGEYYGKMNAYAHAKEAEYYGKREDYAYAQREHGNVDDYAYAKNEKNYGKKDDYSHAKEKSSYDKVHDTYPKEKTQQSYGYSDAEK